MNPMTRPASRLVSLSKTQNHEVNKTKSLEVCFSSSKQPVERMYAMLSTRTTGSSRWSVFCLNSAGMYTALQKVHWVGKQSIARSVVTHHCKTVLVSVFPNKSDPSFGQKKHILNNNYSFLKTSVFILGFCWDCDFFFTAERRFFSSLLCSLDNVLITIGIIIRCYIQVKEVLQLPLQSLKCGPILFILLPAVHHHVIHDFGAVGRRRHSVTMGNLLDHLKVCHGWKNNGQSLQFIKQETMTLRLLFNLNVLPFLTE